MLEGHRPTLVAEFRERPPHTVAEACERIRELTRATTLVLDNACYQHCKNVMAEAERLGIGLLFLPSYSPNLNVIERLWKFTKAKALRGRHYNDFALFQRAVDECLGNTGTSCQAEMKSLMTLTSRPWTRPHFSPHKE